ncbi:MAG: hypothetical protein GY856_02735, partial [bacterium]|nr:hypothetical protein [bacterium]
MGFYAGERRLRVELPNYPFERQRYWIEMSDQMAFSGTGRAGKKQDLAEWFYVPFWKPSVVPDADADAEKGQGGWLLLVDGCGLGSEMARQLEGAGETVVTAEVGEAFAELGPGRYALRPGERADHEALFARLGTVPRRIVHLWTVTSEAPADPVNPQVNPQMVELAFYSLLGHVQALAG